MLLAATPQQWKTTPISLSTLPIYIDIHSATVDDTQTGFWQWEGHVSPILGTARSSLL